MFNSFKVNKIKDTDNHYVYRGYRMQRNNAIRHGVQGRWALVNNNDIEAPTQARIKSVINTLIDGNT